MLALLKQITFAHDRKASILITMLSLLKILTALLLTAFSYQLSAVSVTTRGMRNKAIYGIEFPEETRTYYGSEAGVQSISIQEYITASFRVIELNIVTHGTALLRIYYSRPLRPGELQQAMSDGVSAMGIPGGSSIIQRPLPPQMQAIADRAASVSKAATGTEVMKEYTITTSEYTIELHIISEDDSLDKKMQPHSLGGLPFKVQV